MTPDSLKQARAKEAVRRVDDPGPAPCGWPSVLTFAERVSLETQRLIDIDWRPPEPINPDLIEARECCAIIEDQKGHPDNAQGYRHGSFDKGCSVQSTLLAIERAKGREVGW